MSWVTPESVQVFVVFTCIPRSKINLFKCSGDAEHHLVDQTLFLELEHKIELLHCPEHIGIASKSSISRSIRASPFGTWRFSCVKNHWFCIGISFVRFLENYLVFYLLSRQWVRNSGLRVQVQKFHWVLGRTHLTPGRTLRSWVFWKDITVRATAGVTSNHKPRLVSCHQ